MTRNWRKKREILHFSQSFQCNLIFVNFLKHVVTRLLKTFDNDSNSYPVVFFEEISEVFCQETLNCVRKIAVSWQK